MFFKSMKLTLRIKNGIDLNATNDTGSTALHLTACKYCILLTTVRDRLDIARLLIEHGADKDILNQDNQVAVDLAVSTPMKILLQSTCLIQLI